MNFLLKPVHFGLNTLHVAGKRSLLSLIWVIRWSLLHEMTNRSKIEAGSHGKWSFMQCWQILQSSLSFFTHWYHVWEKNSIDERHSSWRRRVQAQDVHRKVYWDGKKNSFPWATKTSSYIFILIRPSLHNILCGKNEPQILKNINVNGRLMYANKRRRNTMWDVIITTSNSSFYNITVICKKKKKITRI